MKIYIHDAASSPGFNLKTEQEEVFSKALFPFPRVLANLYVLLPKDFLHRVDNKFNGNQHKHNSISKASLSL